MWLLPQKIPVDEDLFSYSGDVLYSIAYFTEIKICMVKIELGFALHIRLFLFHVFHEVSVSNVK